MPINRSAPSTSSDHQQQPQQQATKVESSSGKSTEQRGKKTHISGLAIRLQELQSENSSQSSEIANLKRQIRILSEFKGFSAVEGSGVGIVGLRRELLELLEATNHGEHIRSGSTSNEETMDHTNNENGSQTSGFSSPDKSNKKTSNLSIVASANSTDSNDPLELSINHSAGSDSLPNQFQQAGNKYDDYDEAQLEEFAKIASPKVCDILNEQALALDDLLGTPGWSSSDSDSDDYSGSRKRGRRKGGRGHKQNRRASDEDSMNEEWDQLEAAQLNLKDELDAATNGFSFAQMLHDNDGIGDYDGDHRSYSQNNMEGDGDAESKQNDSYSEEWRDSIHQYYTDNNQSTRPNHNDTGAPISQSTRPDPISESTRPDPISQSTRPDPISQSTRPNHKTDAPVSHSTSTRPNHSTGAPISPALPSKSNHSYSLADHALTLDVSRPESDRGLYSKPLLSRNELETLGIVTMPGWIARPNGEVSSRGREKYMKRILNCTLEYIEPPKSRNLRRLYSGWNPGPGERKPGDDRGERVVNRGGGDDSQRVMAYSPSKNDEDADSSVDGDDNNDNFEDIDGMAYASPSTKRVMEPLPVRTVTVRIRPDVLCGAVMDALTTSVERVGGEMTKRQGGHLRAVLRGRKMRVWMPGEWEREHGGENNVDNGGNASLHAGESKDTGEASHLDENIDDAYSVASGLSAILSPVLGRPKESGPLCEVLPPYIVDAQLITKKVGKECQRLVLIRTYRMQDVARVRSTLGGGDDEEAFDVIAPLDHTGVGADVGVSNANSIIGENKEKRVDPLLESKRSLEGLQEASALVQRIKAVGGSGFAIEPPQPSEGDTATVSSHTSTKSYFKSFGDAITSPIRYFGGSGDSSALSTMKSSISSPYPTVMELMSTDLLRKNVPSPSVGTNSKSAMAAAKQKSHGIFPSLSNEDSPYVKSSWIFLRDCVEEFDRRCLAYSTLGINPIFQFPALPTIDVHFIAQIKAFCRESMIVSLVKTASELEIYAREFEVSCGNVDQLLRPTFEMYKLAPPQLPTPVPLTAYPLDFRAPEEIKPPWGPEAMSALDKISNDLVITSTENEQTQTPLSSFERSEKAISMVVAAFQQQNDVEQGARLGRKNMQVMDRLAKMQAHKRNSIAKIRCSYGSNLLATKAGDEFHSLRQKSSNVGSLTDVINAVPDEVPLLICNVLVGNAAGTCYVTHSHILFNTQLVPILGGSKIHLFSILDVDVTINAPSKSMLSPLPASISLSTHVYGSKSTREEVYNFIPSIGARRFAKFLEVLRDIALEDPNSLKFSDKGGLIYLAD